jgi:eukaryotic-like serine/threonine-protein kinase
MAYANPYASLIRAGIARLRGDDTSAVAFLEKASREFEASDMTLYAVVTRHRLGEMIGGDRGQELQQDADEWMSRQLIKNPSKLMNLLAPGFS